MTAKQDRTGQDAEPGGLTELAATRVSGEAKKLITKRAGDAAISEAAWMRRVLYRALGLLKKEEV